WSPGGGERDSTAVQAIGTGMVDIVLRAAEMPPRLMELGGNLEALIARSHPMRQPAETEQAGTDQGRIENEHARSQSRPNELALREILELLRNRTGHDFQHYKQATVLRRIERPPPGNALHDMPAYARFLHARPEETAALLADMLIGVTNFFRDREAFEALER